MFTYKGYTAKIEIDTEAGLLGGKVLNINDTVSFHGGTVAEAEQDFRKNVDKYLEFCQKQGKEPDKPFSGKLPFRTTPETHRAIYQAANKADKSINAWMEEILSEAAKQRLSRKAPSKDEAPSPSVQHLIEDRKAFASLIVQVEPFLKSKEPYVIFQVINALEKLLTGIDAIKPFLKVEESNAVVQVVAAIESLLQLPDLNVVPSHPELLDVDVLREVNYSADLSTAQDQRRY
jgi:predicted HicB family RNase H-like nuclease